MLVSRQCPGFYHNVRLPANEQCMVALSPLLLADEPTGSLDQATGSQVLELLRQLNRAGQTVIMVTHDSAAASHAGRTVEIVNGQIQA